MDIYDAVPKDCRNVDDFLQFLLIKESTDKIEYSNLSEEKKKHLSNVMITNIFNSIKRKSLQINLSMIEKSEGDIKKLAFYNDLKQSINFLMVMRNRDGDAPEIISEFEACLQTLEKYSMQFNMGFKNDKELIKLLYNNMVAALVNGVSFVISATIDYVKEQTGTYKSVFRKNVQISKSSSLFLDSIVKFNRYAREGKLNKFLSNELQAEKAIGTVVAIGVTAIAVVAIFIWILREIIYQYYYQRNQLSDALKNLASFVQMNTAVLDSDSKKVKERQEKIIKNLLIASDKIAVDHKVSTKKAIDEISRENGRDSIKDLSNDNLL
jgi:hypothetical protein